MGYRFYIPCLILQPQPWDENKPKAVKLKKSWRRIISGHKSSVNLPSTATVQCSQIGTWTVIRHNGGHRQLWYKRNPAFLLLFLISNKRGELQVRVVALWTGGLRLGQGHYGIQDHLKVVGSMNNAGTLAGHKYSLIFWQWLSTEPTSSREAEEEIHGGLWNAQVFYCASLRMWIILILRYYVLIRPFRCHRENSEFRQTHISNILLHILWFFPAREGEFSSISEPCCAHKGYEVAFESSPDTAVSPSYWEGEALLRNHSHHTN